MMISRALTGLGIVKILFGQNGEILIKYMGYKIQSPETFEVTIRTKPA